MKPRKKGLPRESAKRRATFPDRQKAMEMVRARDKRRRAEMGSPRSERASRHSGKAAANSAPNSTTTQLR